MKMTQQVSVSLSSEPCNYRVVVKPGFPTVPKMPACRPDEFYADQHVEENDLKWVTNEKIYCCF